MAKLEPLFNELDQHIKRQDFTQALSSAEKILKIAPDDEDAFACQIICLIQLDEFEKALPLLEKRGTGKYVFERAYCLYRLKRYSESLALIDAQPQPRSNPILNLEAQVRYALEDAKCISVYEQLFDGAKEPSPELKTNYLAALTLANPKDKALTYISNHKDTNVFEFAHNAACIHVAIGDLVAAEKELKLSEELCRKAFSGDDFTQEELEEELAPVLVQQGLVHQLLGQTDEALNLYTAALKSKPSDDVVSAVASNNIAVIHKDKDLFDSEKRLKVASSEKLQLKLTSTQKQIISFNQCLLLLHMNKTNKCMELIQSLRETIPDSPVLALIQASLLFRTKKVKESEDLLKEEIQKHPNSEKNVKLLLSLAQIHLSKAKSDPKEVIEILCSVPSLRQKPGIASLLVLLYEHMGDTASAVQVLDQCVASYATQKQLTEKQKREYANILKATGDFKKNHGLYEQAAAAYKALLSLNRNDVESLHNLVLITADFDPQQAEEYLARIPIKIDPSVNAESLENLPAPSLSTRRKEEREMSTGATNVKASKVDKAKKKKKRKPLRPKNLDPNAKPDPERWLPMKERSYYRPRRGARGRGAQGSSKNASASSTTTGVTTPASQPTPPQVQPKKNQGKKKKGRR